MSCFTPLLDPNNNVWILGVTDSGLLTTSLASNYKYLTNNPPILAGASTDWAFSADAVGRIVINSVPKVASHASSATVVSPSGIIYNLTVLDPPGMLQTTSTTGAFPDTLPRPTDVTMSVFPYSRGVLCTACGNAAVLVGGDFSCWCCTCASFVSVDDTNMIVELEE